MKTMTYTEWLAEGRRGATGTIDFLDKTGRMRYVLIQPDEFPEMRIIFGIVGWVSAGNGLVGSRIVFDMMAQEIRPEQKAVAANVRFQNDALNRKANG